MVHFSSKSVRTAILIFACCTVFSLEILQGAEARALHHNRVKRGGLNDDQREYLENLHLDFREVFERSYRRTEDSVQFAVATINRPANLNPCGLSMNANTVSPSYNYLAYTPQPSTTRPNGQIHAEINIINHFGDATRGISVQGVYLVSHFSPCRYCSDRLRTFVTNNPQITFYIGYIERYQNEDILNYFISQVGNQDNVCFGQINSLSHRPCHDELKRRSATCPVIDGCTSGGGGGGGGCFPSSAFVYTRNFSSMEDLRIGDEVLTMNAHGKLMYSPIIAFLDRLPSAMFEFVEIQTESKHKLLLTSSHLIFTNASSMPLYASDVEPGDYVFTLNPDDNIQPSKVTRVGTVSAVGNYAPLTAEGTMIVDGILVSCYTEVTAKQKDIHALFAPLRLLYDMLPQGAKEHASQEGIHWYARTLMHIREHMKEHLPSAILPSIVTG